MLQHVGADSLDALSDEAVPAAIRMQGDLDLPAPRSEVDVLAELKAWAQDNPPFTSLLGQGYYGTILPGVIQRNILENPGWYTQYTPYQPEISQGRLEALVNYQTMVTDLTGLPLANSSLLDEATAAAEAMSMCFGIARQKKKRFLVANNVFPQTLAVVQTRAEPIAEGETKGLFSRSAEAQGAV
ncbi:MAG: glycine dehydrogenase (aminomethyl-transferring), partial [Myxococcota bacterium]